MFWQKDHPGPNRACGPADHFAPAAGQVIRDDDIVGVQSWQQHVLDIALKAVAIDRRVDQPWRADLVAGERRDQGRGVAAAARCLRLQPLAARRPIRNGAMLVSAEVSSMNIRRDGLIRG